MADFTTLFNSLAGLFSIQQGANISVAGANQQAANIFQGGMIAAEGYTMNAQALRDQSVVVGQASNFNLAIDEINLNRKMESLARNYRRSLGDQMAQQASSGLSLTSKSFLQIQNETSSLFERTMLNLKTDAENMLRSKVFETQIQQTALENQARAAQYNAAASKVIAANQAAEAEYRGQIAQHGATQKMLGGLPTLLGQLF